MKPEEAAWFAGIIDGEGTITLTKENRYIARIPSVSVTSTTYPIIEKCLNLGGGYVVEKPSKNEKWSKAWVWKRVGGPAVSILQECLPFMVEPEKVRRSKMLIFERFKAVPRNGKYNKLNTAVMDKFEDDFFKNSRKFSRVSTNSII